MIDGVAKLIAKERSKCLVKWLAILLNYNDFTIIQTFSGGNESIEDMCSIIVSQIIIPCGPPNPRKAVLDGKFVLHKNPVNCKFGKL